MRKLLGNRKALSPVVAAIILIAVTVAVSIAVAAWMGALTIGFMGAGEQLTITAVKFVEAGVDPLTDATIVISAYNGGADKLVIVDAKVAGESLEITSAVDPAIEGDGIILDAGKVTMDAGSKAEITVTFPWTAGTRYEIELVTANGNRFPYPATAPS